MAGPGPERAWPPCLPWLLMQMVTPAELRPMQGLDVERGGQTGSATARAVPDMPRAVIQSSMGQLWPEPPSSQVCRWLLSTSTRLVSIWIQLKARCMLTPITSTRACSSFHR